MRRRFVEAAALVAGAAIFGYAMEGLPAPADPTIFFVGNFSAPWAVLAFLIGWSRRKPGEAIAVAVAGEIACVVGFYGRSFTLDPLVLGLARDTAPVVALATWLRNFVSYAGQWLVAGVAAGVAYGWLGAWWARSRSLIPAMLLALPFFLEPVAWRAYDGYLKGPTIISGCEAAAGVGLLVTMGLLSRRGSVREGA